MNGWHIGTSGQDQMNTKTCADTQAPKLYFMHIQLQTLFFHIPECLHLTLKKTHTQISIQLKCYYPDTTKLYLAKNHTPQEN